MRHFDVFTRSTHTDQVFSAQTIAAPNSRAAVLKVPAQYDRGGAPLPNLMDADIRVMGDGRIIIWPTITLEIIAL